MWAGRQTFARDACGPSAIQARFSEDRLRMLRAVRFGARFGFRLDAQTLAAIRELAPQITSVSAERQRDEIVKILTEGPARAASSC